jgi:hypothetical protein
VTAEPIVDRPSTAQMIEKVCRLCGTEFSVRLSQRGQSYCSPSHAIQARKLSRCKLQEAVR